MAPRYFIEWDSFGDGFVVDTTIAPPTWQLCCGGFFLKHPRISIQEQIQNTKYRWEMQKLNVNTNTKYIQIQLDSFVMGDSFLKYPCPAIQAQIQNTHTKTLVRYKIQARNANTKCKYKYKFHTNPSWQLCWGGFFQSRAATYPSLLLSTIMNANMARIGRIQKHKVMIWNKITPVAWQEILILLLFIQKQKHVCFIVSRSSRSRCALKCLWKSVCGRLEPRMMWRTKVNLKMLIYE